MASTPSFIEQLANLLRNYTDKLEQQDHPRHWEWTAHCEALRQTGKPEGRIPAFSTWLRDQEQEESNAGPRIKGANPPIANLHVAATLWGEVGDFRTYFVFALIGCVFGLLFLIAGQVFLGLLAIGGCGWAAQHFVQEWQKKTDQRAVYTKPIPLDAYNTEFTCPLADRSMLRATVHFQIPRELNYSAPATYTAPAASSHFVEQLNRVTEAKLITYTQDFAEPPSRLEIEKYLNHQLVQFQDENDVRVLRVSVPIVIHVHPDKPRGVHV